MAIFTNQATLSYNGNTTTSNITTGELLEVLSATKTAVLDSYSANNYVTYIVSIINSGSTAFNNLTLTDNLGSYTYDTATLVPLTYIPDSIRYYVGGTLQAAPAVTAGPPLVITGITVPANSNAMLIYQVETNSFAPPAAGSTITNTATVSGVGLSNSITADATVTADTDPILSISKSIYPTTVTENGQITYTFVIQNNGNTATTLADNVIVTDDFDPILNAITVTFNGTTWTENVNYTYSATSGRFETLSGQVTVPGATYTQDATTGSWIVNPGVSILTVTGTI